MYVGYANYGQDADNGTERTRIRVILEQVQSNFDIVNAATVKILDRVKLVLLTDASAYEKST